MTAPPAKAGGLFRKLAFTAAISLFRLFVQVKTVVKRFYSEPGYLLIARDAVEYCALEVPYNLSGQIPQHAPR